MTWSESAVSGRNRRQTAQVVPILPATARGTRRLPALAGNVISGQFGILRSPGLEQNSPRNLLFCTNELDSDIRRFSLGGPNEKRLFISATTFTMPGQW